MKREAEKLSTQLNRLNKRIIKDVGEVIKKLAFDLYADIKEGTPYATGHAWRNWMIEPTNNGWVIYNNVEYIEVLENGHSKKAPHGMVAINIVHASETVRRICEHYDGLEAA